MVVFVNCENWHQVLHKNILTNNYFRIERIFSTVIIRCIRQCRKYNLILTPQSVAKLSSYAEELVKKLKDPKARDHARNRIQKLGFNKEQTYTLIPVQLLGGVLLL